MVLRSDAEGRKHIWPSMQLTSRATMPKSVITYCQALQERGTAVQIQVAPPSEICGLLQEDCVRAENSTDINWNALLVVSKLWSD